MRAKTTKANSIINRLITENRLLDTIGVIVLDEMHMIGNSSRGYILELMLTKIRFVQEKSKQEYETILHQQLQLGLSYVFFFWCVLFFLLFRSFELNCLIFVCFFMQ